jgi:hypothetical protein
MGNKTRHEGFFLRPKRAVSRLVETPRDFVRRRMRWNSTEKAIRLFRNYSKEQGYYKDIAKSVVRFMQIVGDALKESKAGERFAGSVELNPKEIADGVIVVPQGHPISDKVFGTGRHAAGAFSYGHYILLPEARVKDKNKSRTVLRHELSHQFFGQSELIPVMVDFIGAYGSEGELALSPGLWAKFTSKGKQLVSKLEDEAVTKRQKRYARETALGEYAAKKYVEIAALLGKGYANIFFTGIAMAKPRTEQEIDAISDKIKQTLKKIEQK